MGGTPPPHPSRSGGLAADGLIALLIAAASLVLLAHGGLPLPNAHRVTLTPLPALLTVGAALPLVLWRHWPLATVMSTAAISVVLAVAGGLVWPPLGIGAAIYLFARGPRDGAPWPRGHLVLAGGAVVVFLVVAVFVSPVAPVFHSALVCAGLWLVGERSRLRRLEVHDLRTEAVRAARENERERELALLAERARIARDLHDTTAHALNVIALRAGTARLREDPGYALGVLSDVEGLARDTIADVDRVVANLRTRADGVESPPGMAAFDGLVRQHLDAGHRVTVAGRDSVPAMTGAVDQGVFRMLQEALTNAAKHGTGTTSIRFDGDDETWTAQVTNPIAAGRTSGGRHGLVGMRERASAIGGTVRADQAAGRFELRITLPHRSPR